MLKDKKNAIIFSLIAMFLWATAIPLIKFTYAEFAVGPDETGLKILLAGLRFFMAGFVTLLFYRISKSRDEGYEKINMRLVLILALVQTFLQYLFFYIGVSNTSGVKSSIIQAANSFIIVILSALMMPGDQINSKIILALILGTSGVIITSASGKSSYAGFNLTGDGFILISTSLNALASILVRKYGQGQNGYKITAYQFILGGGGILIVGLLLAERPISMSLAGLVMLLYGAFLSAAAFSIWTIVMQYHSANEFGVYKLFIPIFGSILSVLILGEVFTLRLFIGMLLVLSGSLILNMNMPKFDKKRGVVANQ